MLSFFFCVLSSSRSLRSALQLQSWLETLTYQMDTMTHAEAQLKLGVGPRRFPPIPFPARTTPFCAPIGRDLPSQSASVQDVRVRSSRDNPYLRR